MERTTERNSRLIDFTALFFTAALLLSAAFATLHDHDSLRSLFAEWHLIMITPCPLVTDYFELGSLSSAMLNAGACGLLCCIFMLLLKGPSTTNTLAGFFLVIAHCFYGLNLLNMIPCFFAPFVYLKLRKLDFKENLSVCMFSTAFGPFISEFLFRYTIYDSYVYGTARVTASGILLVLLFTLMLAFVVPAILPGAKKWHKGFNLFNGGLAFGIFGFFAYNFFYQTMGVGEPFPLSVNNVEYFIAGRSYRFYCNVFFLIVFAACFCIGFWLNGRSLKGYGMLLKDTGYSSNFSEKYGMPVVLINIGIYGFMILGYTNLIIYFTEGAGFTGPTVGVILASLTFPSMGQHPRNVWPILFGYLLLYWLTLLICQMTGRHITWSISSQAYINGVAFATGLCPIAGSYGRRAGMIAGILCASMCTATRDLHGGLMLYNGGLTAGLAAIILLPMLEHYFPESFRKTVLQFRLERRFGRNGEEEEKRERKAAEKREEKAPE